MKWRRINASSSRMRRDRSGPLPTLPRSLTRVAATSANFLRFFRSRYDTTGDSARDLYAARGTTPETGTTDAVVSSKPAVRENQRTAWRGPVRVNGRVPLCRRRSFIQRNSAFSRTHLSGRPIVPRGGEGRAHTLSYIYGRFYFRTKSPLIEEILFVVIPGRVRRDYFEKNAFLFLQK